MKQDFSIKNFIKVSENEISLTEAQHVFAGLKI